MKVCIEDGLPEDVMECARIACNSEIGKRYGFSQEALARKLGERLGQGALLIIARESIETCEERGPAAVPKSRLQRRIAGFAWVEPTGAFGIAPYLKLIAVDESVRSRGIGGLLLNEFEARTASNGRAWILLVSDFNDKAISFYQAHGYSIAGKLERFVRPDIDEILMYKRHE